jgi:hypothetical protein
MGLELYTEGINGSYKIKYRDENFNNEYVDFYQFKEHIAHSEIFKVAIMKHGLPITINNKLTFEFHTREDAQSVLNYIKKYVK